MSKMDYKLLRECTRLSPQGKGGAFEYVQWLRDLEVEERLRRTPRTWTVRCPNKDLTN